MVFFAVSQRNKSSEMYFNTLMSIYTAVLEYKWRFLALLVRNWASEAPRNNVVERERESERVRPELLYIRLSGDSCSIWTTNYDYIKLPKMSTFSIGDALRSISYTRARARQLYCWYWEKPCRVNHYHKYIRIIFI